MIESRTEYGVGDATFQSVGGETGVTELVDHFYDVMERDYPVILSWHPPGKAMMREKLSRFLCGWMGGPKRYQEKYGPISIPKVHAHLKVGKSERDAWLDCMRQALQRQGCDPLLSKYLLEKLFVPAEAVRIQSNPD